MAHVPSYMIFDDHDVTDDWNLNFYNQQAFQKNLQGRQVQTNALAAYWLCQGWGNNPSAFDNKFRITVESYLTDYSAPAFTRCEATLNAQYWGYALEGVPHVLVLDTRSRRSYNQAGEVSLVNLALLKDLQATLQKLPTEYKQNNSLLLISAAPAYGFNSIERVQLMGTELAGRIGKQEQVKEALDTECWIANAEAFSALQQMLVYSGFNKVSIFSGDVHYGFCRYEDMEKRNGNKIQLFQLTSSSLHNAMGPMPGILMDFVADAEVFRRLFSPYLMPRQGRGEFIRQSTNLGMLKLQQGKPVSYTLFGSEHVSDGIGGKGRYQHVWQYDLLHPQTLNALDATGSILNKLRFLYRAFMLWLRRLGK